MNLLNFFNTFDGLPGAADNCRNGVGGAPTDCRGADTQAEFDRQWPKTVAAVLGSQADIIGFNEVENDGYGPDSALQYLVDKLNAATAPGTYALIDADANTGQLNVLGTDAIKVAMIYKPAKVTPVGQTGALNTSAFVNGGDSAPRSRPALAQAFQENLSGSRFVVVANHLKSKGSACEIPDQGDGQGNCSIVRTNAAIELANWLATDPTGTGDPDVLIVGDLNSYAKEDPITALITRGYTNLIEAFLGSGAYSYVFDGQWGYLDHALANAAMLPQVAGVAEWHINADEPSVLDYNTDFKTPNLQATLYAPDEFRIADHDPVLVDLKPNNVPPAIVAIVGPTAPLAVNTAAAFTASFTDPGIQDTHTAVWNWGDGTSSAGTVAETGGSGTVGGSHVYVGPGIYTVELTVTDNNGGSDTATFQYVVVYDPNGGFVTGGGWIDSPAGAYLADPALAGKANFGFVAKYQKGANVPTGNTQFQFQAAGLNFQSTSYEWLVITGAKAQYRGTGTINGGGSYGFTLTAIDGGRGSAPDTLRFQIWDMSQGNALIYDNLLDAPGSADPTTVLGGGSIVIHGGKVGKSDAGEEPAVTDRLYLPGIQR
jgi:PKD repeat protein